MIAVPVSTQDKKSRLITLDYLRGFFIVVIIIDHFSRWPSLLGLLSGKAMLWVTAAEGFVAISGLLVGYIRGYKNKDLPMITVARKLLSRAVLLYMWAIIAAIVYTSIIWYVPLAGGAPGIPIVKGDWATLITQILTFKYTFVWTHFLTLYALFLAAAPLAVWLLRRNKAWLVILLSLIALGIGRMTNIESLQWQVLFFIPTVAGYYLPSILKWWNSLVKTKRSTIGSTIIGLTLATLLLSVFSSFYYGPFQVYGDALNNFFLKDEISIWRVIVSFLWFTGFVLLFSRAQKFIGKAFGWLLLPFGTKSLTAYILHGVAICLISFFTVSGDNIVSNTLLGILCILLVWGMLKIPSINKVIPS